MSKIIKSQTNPVRPEKYLKMKISFVLGGKSEEKVRKK